MISSAYFTEIEKFRHSSTPFCLVTIVDGRGSLPQIIGAKAIFTKDGLCYGTVGGGKIEVKCQEMALELLGPTNSDKTRFYKWNVQRDLKMTCGGEVSLYFEVYRPDLHWNIVVFGAGHIAQQLCRFLIELDCLVQCIDIRKEWLEKLPQSDKLDICHVANYRDGVKKIPENAFVILMTMGHEADAPILREISKRNLKLPYLGMIGSDSKARIMRKELKEDGIADDFINSIISPVGEGFGDNTPPEISISIIAQLLKRR